MRKAVIDVGSNSVLLLVEELRDSVWIPVHEETAVTALGEGTKATGVLSPPRMEETLDAIKAQFRSARDHGVERPHAAATMAVRIANNQGEFLELAESQGTPVHVLSGEDEARLGFEAVAYDPTFAAHSEIAIVDPGGHSTELLIAENREGAWKPKFLHSFSVGTLGLKSHLLPDETPGPPEIIAATIHIDEALAREQVPPTNCPVVVLGATGTNLVSIREALPDWQPEKVHGAYLLFEEISRGVGWMMAMTDTERRAIVGLEAGREKTLHVGALVLERSLHALRAEGCYVSVRGWRHALLERGLHGEADRYPLVSEGEHTGVDDDRS